MPKIGPAQIADSGNSRYLGFQRSVWQYPVDTDNRLDGKSTPSRETADLSSVSSRLEESRQGISINRFDRPFPVPDHESTLMQSKEMLHGKYLRFDLQAAILRDQP